MFRTQKTYGALWDYAEEIKTGKLTIQEATGLCLSDRNREAKALRKQGLKVVCGSLPNQLRQYWSLGNPCNMVCNCYMLTVI